VKPLLETLVVELERARELPAQVVNHLAGNYGVEREGIGDFLVKELPGLEDYEIDIILSPVFTPKLHDQSVFAELLGRDSVPCGEWPALVRQLAARPTRARIIVGGNVGLTLPLREVSIERYVHRLRLEATITEALFNLITHLPPSADHPMLKAIARRAAWEGGGRCEILMRYLINAIDGDVYHLADTIDLLKLVETYQLADVGDLLAHIPHWQQVLRREIQVAGSPRAFYNERVQELHGGGRDQRRQNDERIAAKENEQAFLERLENVMRQPVRGARHS